DRDLDDNDIQVILWELSEVGFHIEMMSLDARLHAGSEGTVQAEQSHRHVLGLCFLKLEVNLAWIVSMEDANQGLGNPVWMEHAPYVCALCWVMCSWPNCPSRLQEEQAHYDEQQFLQMEHTATTFYIDSFFMNFGHVPILPRVLAHPPP
ncbi:uncharacterized protein EV420DRAFT_1214890, partial [Desarmillaria tabescens]